MLKRVERPIGLNPDSLQCSWCSRISPDATTVLTTLGISIVWLSDSFRFLVPYSTSWRNGWTWNKIQKVIHFNWIKKTSLQDRWIDHLTGAVKVRMLSRSVHTSANLIFHFSNVNGKRTYYLSLSYLHISKYRKKEKKRKWSVKSIIFSFF